MGGLDEEFGEQMSRGRGVCKVSGVAVSVGIPILEIANCKTYARECLKVLMIFDNRSYRS